MKVLFLTNIPSPNRVAFFNEFGKLCDLTVTFELHRSSERDEAWVGEKIENFTPIFLKGKQTAVDAAFCPGILKQINNKWDKIIVSTYNTPTSMLAMQYMMIRRIDYWIEADGGFVKQDNKIKHKIKSHFISHATSWLSSGKMTTDYLCYYGADRSKCYVYPFTSVREQDIIDAGIPGEADRKMAKKDLEIPEKYAVISVGRFNYEGGYGKGYDTLLKVAERFKESDIGFYIIGDNPTQEFIDWKKDKKLDKVHYIPFKTKEELTKYYVVADIFLLLTRGDTWGLAVNEAMAAGLPVITTDRCIAGTELVVNDENGYIVSADDTENVAEKIHYLIDDEDRRIKFGCRSYKRILNYTLENMAQEHISILGGVNNLLKEYARRRIGVDQKLFAVLCVSQVIYRKGVDVLIKSIETIDNEQLKTCIVGGYADDGMTYDENRISFHGFKTKEELRDYYKAADIFVLPTREDIWGLVINEAMSFGLPVITTDRCISGIEMINDNGQIVEADNALELKSAMQPYIENPDSISNQGFQSLRIIRNYTLENMAKVHMQILINK